MNKRHFLKSLLSLIGVAIVAPKELLAEKKDEIVVDLNPKMTKEFGTLRLKPRQTGIDYLGGTMTKENFHQLYPLTIDECYSAKEKLEMELLNSPPTGIEFKWEENIKLPDWVKYVKTYRTKNPNNS